MYVCMYMYNMLVSTRTSWKKKGYGLWYWTP